MPLDFEQYRQDVAADVAACFDALQCQPILFCGSGVSRRYFEGPSWYELLEQLATACPRVNKPFAYFQQKYAHQKDIGEALAEYFMEWAWTDEGRQVFPETLFVGDVPANAFIKHFAAKLIAEKTPVDSSGLMTGPYREELALLRAISPHAIITSNYDTLLELLFPDYAPVVGETVLRASYASIGEIFKIHGSVGDPGSMVLTASDYEDFVSKRKYMSAKLLTYFAEHPLLFVGYSASDPNITHILSDIDVILASQGDLIPNLYLLEWRKGIDSVSSLQREHVVDVGSGRSVRIKAIYADDFRWIFEAFAAEVAIPKVNVKLLRALQARTCEVVRHDAPRKTLEVNYTQLEHVLETSETLANVLGIQTVTNSTLLNADFPYFLTDVGKQLGYKSWHKAHQLIDRLAVAKKVDIKASDNKYHVAIRAGSNSVLHKYSALLVEVLKKVRDGEPYDVVV